MDSTPITTFTRCQRCNEENVPVSSEKAYVRKYCPDCYKEVLRESLTKSKEKAKERAKNPEEIKFLNESEKAFYEERKRQYYKDFDFCDSADSGLLSRLLSLELESKRIEDCLSRELSSEQRVRTARTLAVVIKSIRDTQKALGIMRSIREGEQKEDMSGIIKDTVDRYLKYKKEHPEQFSFKCEHCGQISYPNRRNEKI